MIELEACMYLILTHHPITIGGLEVGKLPFVAADTFDLSHL